MCSSDLPTAVGSYSVVASLNNANYAASNATGTLVITKANQTITFAAIPDRSLSSGFFNASATASSGLTVTFTSLTTNTCTVSGKKVTPIATGTCTIGASQAGDANYNPAPTVDQSFQIY